MLVPIAMRDQSGIPLKDGQGDSTAGLALERPPTGKAALIGGA